MANLQLPGGDAPGVDMVVVREIPSIRRYAKVGSAAVCRRAKCKVQSGQSAGLRSSAINEGLITYEFDGRDWLDLTLDLSLHVLLASYVVHSLFLRPSFRSDLLSQYPFLYNQRLYLLVISSSETPPSCIDRFVAALTAEIVAERKPLSLL